MKSLLFLVLCALSVHAATFRFQPGNEARLEKQSVRNLDESQIYDFDLPEIELEKEQDGFSQLTINGAAVSADTGNPELLSLGQILVLPQGETPRFQIIEKNQEEIENVLVRPAQERYRCSHNARNFSFNKRLYDSEELVPKTSVSLTRLGNFHGVTLWRLGVTPVQMNFKNRSVIVTTHLRIQIENVNHTHLIKTLPHSILEILETFSTGIKSKIASGTNHLLIVTADALKAELIPLIQAKQQKGYQVTVKTYSELGGSKEKTLAFIKSFYRRNRASFSHLLMVGDKKSNPGFMESTSSGSAASDMRYALLEGNDYIPEIFYGRLLASNLQEARTQIQRYLNHEIHPTPGAFWSYGTTIASSEGSNPSDKQYAEQIAGFLKKGNYTKVDGFYQGQGTATATNIIEALNEGRSWLSYIGHGSGTSWGSTNDNFSNATIATLKNRQLPAIIDVACDNASWVSLSKPFGKAWVTQEADGHPAGALAYYGGSVSISWHPPAVMSVGIAKAYSENKIATLGALVIAGQLHLQKQMGVKKDTTDNLKWYNLFGDPTLELRTVSP